MRYGSRVTERVGINKSAQEVTNMVRRAGRVKRRAGRYLYKGRRSGAGKVSVVILVPWSFKGRRTPMLRWCTKIFLALWIRRPWSNIEIFCGNGRNILEILGGS